MESAPGERDRRDACSPGLHSMPARTVGSRCSGMVDDVLAPDWVAGGFSWARRGKARVLRKLRAT